LEFLHDIQQLSGRQGRSLGKQTPDDSRKRIGIIALLTREEFVRVGFD